MSEDRTDAILDAIVEVFAPVGGWTRVGGQVRSLHGTSVRVSSTDACRSASPAHVALEFVLPGASGAELAFPDCAVGYGYDDDEAVRRAVELWSIRTLPVFLDLTDQDSHRCLSLSGDDSRGIRGWRVIHGPVTTRCARRQDAAPLATWLAAHPLLGVVGAELAAELDPARPHGIRLFLGGTVDSPGAAVLVDGTPSVRATSALERAGWPSSRQISVVHCYVMAVHPEPPGRVAPDDTASPAAHHHARRHDQPGAHHASHRRHH
jgi:Family of unknown function (DUF6348)